MADPPTAIFFIFSFIFFVNSESFTSAEVESYYRDTALDELPTFACFLDLGILLYAKILKNGFGQLMPVSYYISPVIDAKQNDDNRWVIMHWGTSEKRRGANLMALCVALLQHMQSCLLNPPNLHTYLALSLDYEGGEILE